MTYRNPPAAPARRAFTVIELLVVVALIAILSSLLIVGIGKMSTSAKRQQTVALLHNCQSLLASYDAVAHPKFPYFSQPCPERVTVEGSTDGQGTPTAPVTNFSNDRFRENVQITRSFFALMRTVPNVRSGLDKIPAQQFMPTTKVVSYTFDPTNTWLSGRMYTTNAFPRDPTQPVDATTYATVPTSNDSAVYICMTPHTASDGSTVDLNGNPVPANRPPELPNWLLSSTDPSVRLVQDAWGNPIIFCIGSGLGTPHNPPVVIPPNRSSLASPARADGNLYVNGQSVVVSSPDQRPFFASAGPDGDFGLGDDNLYSFEQ